MNMVTKEAMDFLEKAKESFLNEDQMVTCVSEDFIALRTGFREDNIAIYKLDGEVGDFVGQLPSQHKVLVDYDEINKLNKLKEFIDSLTYNPFVENTEQEMFVVVQQIQEIHKKIHEIDFKLK